MIEKRGGKMKNKRLGLIFKIIVGISLAAIVAIGIVYFIEAGQETKSYFTIHFAVPILLALVGVIALFLPKVTTKSYSGESRGDNLMIVVGFLLFVCALFSLVMSYLG